MATDLLSPVLAFRALSDQPDGDDENDLANSDADDELEDDDAEPDDDELAEEGFGIEQGDESSE